MENDSLRIGLFIFILIFIFCLVITIQNFNFYKKSGKMRYWLGDYGKWGKTYSKPQGKRAWLWNINMAIISIIMIIILSLVLLVS